VAHARALEAEQNAENAKETARAEIIQEQEEQKASERARIGPQKWDTWTEGKPFTLWCAHTGRNVYMSSNDRYTYNESVNTNTNREVRRRLMTATVIDGTNGLAAYIHLGTNQWVDQLYRAASDGRLSYENYGSCTNKEDWRREWYLHRMANGDFEISLKDPLFSIYQHPGSTRKMCCERLGGDNYNTDDHRRQWRISTTQMGE